MSVSDTAINGDLTRRVFVDTASMDWQGSPGSNVWRKRVHLVGPSEAGQVTSVVRYGPGASFPSHTHPDGEEILVLEGIFSDEHGDWPAGSYLLNPHEFSHAPFSREGCLLFVKLRQYPGARRRHVVVDTTILPWTSTPVAGVEVKSLYSQQGFDDSTSLERWLPGTELGECRYEWGVEFFVLEGEFDDEQDRYRRGCWLRLPAGGEHRPRTSGGCTVYIKRAGLTYLESAPGSL